MFGMSTEQIMGLIRQILPVLGGIAVSLGWLTSGQVGDLTATVLQIAGPGLIIISTIWSLLNKTQANLVATVASMPEVKKVELQPTVAGVTLERQTPPNVQVAR